MPLILGFLLLLCIGWSMAAKAGIASRPAGETFYGAMADNAALRHGVEPAMLRAIVRTESNWDPNAVNDTGGDAARGGAYGLGQMTLKTALGLDSTATAARLLEPLYNLDICAKLIAANMALGPSDVDVICRYNSGKSWANAPTFTRADYLPRVTKWLTLYRTQSKGVS